MSKDEDLRRLITRLIVLIAVILGVAALLAPVSHVITDGDSDHPVMASLNLFQSLGHYISAKPEHLGDLDSSPYALPGGLALTRIGLLAILIGGIGLGGTSLRLGERDLTRRSAWMITAAGLIVILGVVLAIIGLRWLPDSDDLTNGPAFGLWLVLAVAVWVMHAAWSLHHLDE